MTIRIYTREWWEILYDLRAAVNPPRGPIEGWINTRQSAVDGSTSFDLDQLGKQVASFRTARIYTYGGGQLLLKVFARTVSPDHYLVLDLGEMWRLETKPPTLSSVLGAFWVAQNPINFGEPSFHPRIHIPRELYGMFAKLDVHWQDIDGWLFRSVRAASGFVEEQKLVVRHHCNSGECELDPNCLLPLWKKTVIGSFLDGLGIA